MADTATASRVRVARALLLGAAAIALLLATTVAIVFATAGPIVVAPTPGEPIALHRPEPVTGPADAARELAPPPAGATRESGHALTVRVIGDDAEPVPGASVSLLRDPVQEQIGPVVTGSRGEVVVRLPRTEQSEAVCVDVAAPGRVAASEWVAVPEVAEITVRVRRATGAASIRGVLEFAPGQTGEPGPHVYVWRHGTRPPTSAFVAPAGTTASVIVQQVAADGSFAVDGLHFDELYNVAAGCRGWCSGSTVMFVAPGGEPLRIPLYRVHASRLEVRLPNGGRPEPSSFVRVSMPSHPVRDAVSIGQRSIDAAIGGLLMASQSDEAALDWRDRLIAFKVPSHSESALRVMTRIEVPGSQPMVAEVPLPPLGDSLARSVIHIEPQQHVGSIVVSWSDLPPFPPVIESGGPFPLLITLDDLSGARDLTMPIRQLSQAPRRLDGVPIGDYHVRVESEGRFRWISGLVRVGRGSVVPVEVPMKDVAFLQFEVANETGRSFTGRGALCVEFEPLAGAGSNGAFRFFLNSRPYVAQALIPGQYRISAWFTGEREGARRFVEKQADVRAGWSTREIRL